MDDDAWLFTIFLVCLAPVVLGMALGRSLLGVLAFEFRGVLLAVGAIALVGWMVVQTVLFVFYLLGQIPWWVYGLVALGVVWFL